MKLLTYLIAIFLWLGAYIAQANELTLNQRITFESSILDEQRTLNVVLPESYYSNPNATYPVIYLLDGDYNTFAVSGMLDMLANKGQLIPDVILVGIADLGTAKYRSYMTPSFGKDTPDLATNFANYLIEEVKPYIKKHYRTADNSALVGQSIGGLFVVNTLLEQPSGFEHFVAISPSVWVGDNAIVKKAKTKVPNAFNKSVSLHLSLGDETRMGQYDLINVLDMNPSTNLTWQFKHYPNENHNSVGLIALRDALKSIFAGWHINESKLNQMTPEQVISHYVNLQTTWQLRQALPTSVAHSLMRYHYRNNQANDVPSFVTETIKQLPATEQVLVSKQASYVGHFDSPKNALALLKKIEPQHTQSLAHTKAIAGVYEQLNDNQNAQAYYQKALQLAKQQGAKQWQLNILAAKTRDN